MLTGLAVITIICAAGWLVGGDMEAFGFVSVIWLASVLILALTWLVTPLGWFA